MNILEEDISLVSNETGEIVGVAKKGERMIIRSSAQTENDKYWSPKRKNSGRFIKVMEAEKKEVALKFTGKPATYLAFHIMSMNVQMNTNLVVKENGKKYRIVDLAKEMGITVQEVNKTLNLMEFKFYLDEHIKNTKDDTKKIEQKEVLANINNLTENQIITQIIVKDAIEKLPVKEKQVIELRYLQDKSQEVAGKILNTTQVTVSRREKSALKHLKMIFETGKIEKEIKPPRKYNRQTFDININTVNLSGLTELQKKVVYLVTVEKLGYSEIGRRLGKSRANIYSIMRYANKKLEKNS